MTNSERLAKVREELEMGFAQGVPSGTGVLFQALVAIIGVLLGNEASQTVSDDRPALKVGERVRLASGGPEMTVIADGNTLETKITSTTGGCSIVRVAWWAGDGSSNELRDRLLPAGALVRTADLLKQIEQKDREIERGRARAAERIARLHGLAFEDVYVWLARGLTEHQIVEACRRGVSPMEYLR